MRKYITALLLIISANLSAAEPTSTPSPIFDRGGHIGNIESIVVDGKRFYFGFDYSQDLTVSPPIPSQDAMAKFASDHMLMKDGKHDPTFWHEMVDSSIKYSDIASDDANRKFLSKKFSRARELLDDAESNNRSAPQLSIPYHATYLMESITGWNSQITPTPAFIRLGLKSEQHCATYIEESVALLTGVHQLPKGSSYRDAAHVAKICLNNIGSRLPPEWMSLFRELVAQPSHSPQQSHSPNKR